MWKFDPSINEWAFTSQYSTGGSGKGFGNYGTLGNWSPTNIPSERDSAAGWTDSDGNFWLIGGYGLTSSFPAGVLNDLWEFKPSLNEWSWRGGSNSIACLDTGSGVCVSNGRLGSYGALGTPSPGSVPGSRIFANTWTDRNGNLWLFGGQGFDSQRRDGFLNDMWQYGLKGAPTSANAFPPAAVPTFSLIAGEYALPQTLSISEQTPGATIYYTTDRTPPTSNSFVYKASLSVLSSETVEAIAIANNYSASPVTVASYTIDNPKVETPNFSLPAGTYTSTQMVTLYDATAGAAIYYTTDGTDPTSGSTVYNGTITVSVTEILKAIAIAAGYANSTIASAAYTISPPPTFTLQASSTSLTVSTGSPGKVTLTVAPKYGFNSSVTCACSGLPIGAICSFSPSSVTTSGGSATTVLTISADSQSATVVDSCHSFKL